MKLRIMGDSLRLRIAPSEMARLLQDGRIEDTVHLGTGRDQSLIYALEHAAGRGSVGVRYEGARITVVLPSQMARAWAQGDTVGVYGAVELGPVRLEVAVEKDWACRDKGETDNRDTFPNPNQGANC
ncbi:MAG TPA: hypothetical protein VFE01_00840 [Terracidiphilus sp.]|nr:hypothetical protein [Terracidiphilus sp.]